MLLAKKLCRLPFDWLPIAFREQILHAIPDIEPFVSDNNFNVLTIETYKNPQLLMPTIPLKNKKGEEETSPFMVMYRE
ncbi:hypothetical protein C1891_11765 [Pseudomonas sp. GW456-12-1-14-TSB6]|uniref:Uncharacterized protein n=1 Tax=Pseudomonas fluorescens TaxID=294 RepID=A0AAE2DLQ3_PSEFL|nr:hypothetical protein QS95_04960 [Pseudomonas fluorescens]POA37377.1 hypothetical protein C1891_11765 [Pseudomonas sp. GW456-12-1-14-TSB6]